MVKSIARALPVLQPRSCGECSACCTHLAIDDEPIAHPAHVDCARLAEPDEHGARLCDAYEARPDTCSKFQCLWLQGFEGDEYRPDRCGFIARVVENPPEIGGGRVVFDGTRPGAFDEGTIGRTAMAAAGSDAILVVVDVDGKAQLCFPPSVSPAQAVALIERIDALSAKRARA